MSIRTFSHAGETQETAILSLFRRAPKKRLSASQVAANAGLVATPITSVRRAMTYLTKQGLLIKTGYMIPGPYGRRENQWRLSAAGRR